MSAQEFVYVTYIASTPQKIWDALTQPEFTEKFWFGSRWEGKTSVGSKYRMVRGERCDMLGEILESDPYTKLVFTFDANSQGLPAPETPSRVTYLLEQQAGHVKLTVAHDQFPAGSEVIKKVSNGWPMVLAGLKTLLETGAPLPVESSPCGVKAGAAH